MARKKKSAAPSVHHPRDCRGGCGGAGVISEPEVLRTHGNGGTSFYHSRRCAGTPLQTSALSAPAVVPPVDHKQLAAGEGRS